MDTPPELTESEEELYNLSDDELEARFKEAKSKLTNDISMEQPEDEEVPEDSEETEEEINDEINEEVTEEVDEGSDTEQPETKEPETKVEQPAKYKVKANGMEFEFSTEELLKLAPKAMDYTKKMQEISPWRKAISAIQENGLSEEDINLLIEAKKGNKDAITTFLRQTKVDPLDIDMESAQDYKPKQYGRSETELAIEEVVKEIYTDPEYKITQDVVDRQWDNESRKAFASNPTMIKGLHEDIKNGVFAQVAPEAMKIKLLDNGRKSDIEYYLEAGKRYYDALSASQNVVQQTNSRQAQQDAIRKEAEVKKNVSLPKSKAGRKSVTDYLSESDEDYDKWYKSVQSKM